MVVGGSSGRCLKIRALDDCRQRTLAMTGWVIRMITGDGLLSSYSRRGLR